MIDSVTLKYTDSKLEHLCKNYGCLSENTRPAGVQPKIRIRNMCNYRAIADLRTVITNLSRICDTEPDTPISDMLLGDAMERDLDDAARALLSSTYQTVTDVMLQNQDDANLVIRLNRLHADIESEQLTPAIKRISNILQDLEQNPGNVMETAKYESKDSPETTGKIAVMKTAMEDVLRILKLFTTKSDERTANNGENND